VHLIWQFVREISPWNWASVTVAALLYAKLNHDLRTGDTTQNALTFWLWGSLDFINGASTLVQSGNFFLPLFYVLGCATVLLALYASNKAEIEMGANEAAVMALVAISVIGWWTSGAWYATIWSTIGVAIAGWPQLRDGWRIPHAQPVSIYLGFVLVNGLAAIAGREWSVVERLYPVSCMALCFITAGVPYMRRKQVPQVETSPSTV
jgi:hypothetical protein